MKNIIIIIIIINIIIIIIIVIIVIIVKFTWAGRQQEILVSPLASQMESEQIRTKLAAKILTAHCSTFKLKFTRFKLIGICRPMR